MGDESANEREYGRVRIDALAKTEKCFLVIRETRDGQQSLHQIQRMPQTARQSERHTGDLRVCRYLYENFNLLYALAEIADLIYSGRHGSRFASSSVR